MPSGKRIDWSQYDSFLRRYLPKMTITAWVAKYALDISEKAVGARARKLDIKPKKYQPTKEHKRSIAKTISKETPEMVQFVRDNINKLSRLELSKAISLSSSNLAHLINRNKIKLSVKGRKRAMDGTRQAHLGKIPWNKDGVLSEETKAKISEATKGKKNSQYGRGMTEKEKERWRHAYFTTGIIKTRAWLESKEGQQAREKSYISTTTDKFREQASNRQSERIMSGKARNHRGKPSKMDTKKGGKFTTKSTYETRFVELLEADSNVVRFVYEPFKIPYKYNKRMKNYIPDFLVEYIDGREELIEVKPARLVGLKRNKAKIRAGHNHELAFRVVTEEDLGL